MQNSGHFHTIGTLSADDERAERTREFVGDDTPYLRVPGCLSVEGVRVGTTEIPLTETRRYPTDGTHTAFEQVEEPLVQLEQDAQGPVLLRSVVSNNGIWQAGRPVYVVGEWE